MANLSFEREFSKLIGIQNALAKVIEDKNNRAIRLGVVNLASMVSPDLMATNGTGLRMRGARITLHQHFDGTQELRWR